MSSSDAAPLDFRERKRAAARKDIGDVAMSLFLGHGFEETTIDQIAAGAGISPRSFFRYFATKEDVVLGHLADAGLRLRAALADRPADEAPWVALRAAFETLLREYGDSPEELRKTSRMLSETPSLRARHIGKQLQWQELLVPDIARRLDLPAGAVSAQALVGAALACLDAATLAWTLGDEADSLGRFLDEAIAAVRS